MHIQLKTKLIFCLMLGYVQLTLATLPIVNTHSPLAQYLERHWNQSGLLNAHSAELTITGNGTIRFLQITYYSNTACSKILGVASIIDNATGFTFTDQQTIKLSSKGTYKMATDQGITPSDISCIKVYLDGGNQSNKGVSCEAFTDASCQDNQCISSQNKAVNWVENPERCNTSYAYATNKKTKSVSRCMISRADGSLSDCVTTGDNLNKPTGISINNSCMDPAVIARDNLEFLAVG